MNNSTDGLCREIAKRSGGVCLLQFSRGKDSLAAWLLLRKFMRVIPVHQCSLPGLSFVNQSLEYYERFFGTPIERIQSSQVLQAVRAGVFQSLEDEDYNDQIDFEPFDDHAIADYVRAKHGVPRAWCAFGIAANDNINRRAWMKNVKGRNEKYRSFYPCWNWKLADILDAITEAGLKLPRDYLISNRSLSQMIGVKFLERMPAADMAIIEEWFPLIRAGFARNEFRKKHLAAAKV